MKILHVTDFHSHLRWFEWLVDASSQFDLVALTGDIVDFGGIHCNPHKQIDAVRPYLKRINVPLALCSGNHDLLPDNGCDSAQWMGILKRPGVFIDGDVFQLDGFKFRCVPWCSPLPHVASEDFWLMHAPFFGGRTSTVEGGVSFGCYELQDVCLRGQGPLCGALGGHVHSPLAFWSVLGRTISLNPGRGGHPNEPNHITIDLDAGTATHHKPTASGMRLSAIRIFT